MNLAFIQNLMLMAEDGQIAIITIGAIILLIIFLWMVPVGLWFTALVSGVHVSLIQLILMRWRKVPPGIIVNAMITGAKAGIPLNRDELEAHYLAHGHVQRGGALRIGGEGALEGPAAVVAAAADTAHVDVVSGVVIQACKGEGV